MYLVYYFLLDLSTMDSLISVLDVSSQKWELTFLYQYFFFFAL